MVNSQDRVSGVGSLDRFVRRFFFEAMSELMYLVRSDKCGAHNLLKPEYCISSSEVKDTMVCRSIPK